MHKEKNTTVIRTELCVVTTLNVVFTNREQEEEGVSKAFLKNKGEKIKVYNLVFMPVVSKTTASILFGFCP